MKKAIFLTVLISLCFCFVSIARAQTGVQYIGKVCFQLSPNAALCPQAGLSLEVLSYNTATFPVNGSIVFSCADYWGAPQSVPISGTAVLTGNILQMSLNTSGDFFGSQQSISYSISFDIGTLNGSFSSTAVQAPASSGQSPTLQSSAGTVTLTTCP